MLPEFSAKAWKASHKEKLIKMIEIHAMFFWHEENNN
jgi:hypothetical protein